MVNHATKRNVEDKRNVESGIMLEGTEKQLNRERESRLEEEKHMRRQHAMMSTEQVTLYQPLQLEQWQRRKMG